MTTLAELLATRTPDEALAFMLANFVANGVQATAWQSGTLPMQLLQGESKYLAELDATIAKIAQGGYLDLAALVTPEGGPGWLDVLADGLFQEKRKPATFTRGKAVLTDVGGAGATIQPGKVVVSDGTRRFTFQNLQGGTISHLGTLTLDWTATAPGASFNLSNGALTIIQTSLPGVIVGNPAILGSSSWITQQGTDVESNALLVQRCKDKWGTLGSGSTASAYQYWAAYASAEVTRTRLLEDPDTGAVTIVLAGESGPLSTDAFNTVSALLALKRPLCVKLVVVNATATNTNIAGTVYVDGAYDLAATLAAAQASVLGYARSTSIAGLAVREKIEGAIIETPGVANLTLTAPLADLPLSATQVFTPNFLLTASR